MTQVPIAIIGMSSVFPKARTLDEYWQNITQKTDCITDIPASRWNIADYFGPQNTPDKTYSKRGGFIPDVDFDPMEFGVPPNILEFVDASQLLSLVVAKEALVDAGYWNMSEEVRSKTGCILGVGGGQKLMFSLSARMQYPIWERVLRSSGMPEDQIASAVDRIKRAYIPWKEDAFPGMLGNVVAGRIANRFDLGGINCVVDAACATSLAALKMAVSELAEGQVDMMITGGVDTDNSILMYMSFSAVGALSPGEHSKPFDDSADGTMMGEGLGMVVLKRLADAERDGDRIYAVIKGIGASSDGRYKSIYAPRATGQQAALERAYESAGVDPRTVDLIEAHGTGTVAGDLAEFSALNLYFGPMNLPRQSIALGSVKSQIGHTKSAAGAAGIIKTALALHHQVLPPTLHVEQVNSKFDIDNTPFYISQQAQQWAAPENGQPRRAGVSSFGFGGTNFHVVMEEYPGGNRTAPAAPPAPASNRMTIRLNATNYLTDQRRAHFAEGLTSAAPVSNGAQNAAQDPALVEQFEKLQRAAAELDQQMRQLQTMIAANNGQ